MSAGWGTSPDFPTVSLLFGPAPLESSSCLFSPALLPRPPWVDQLSVDHLQKPAHREKDPCVPHRVEEPVEEVVYQRVEVKHVEAGAQEQHDPLEPVQLGVRDRLEHLLGLVPSPTHSRPEVTPTGPGITLNLFSPPSPLIDPWSYSDPHPDLNPISYDPLPLLYPCSDLRSPVMVLILTQFSPYLGSNLNPSPCLKPNLPPNSTSSPDPDPTDSHTPTTSTSGPPRSCPRPKTWSVPVDLQTNLVHRAHNGLRVPTATSVLTPLLIRFLPQPPTQTLSLTFKPG